MYIIKIALMSAMLTYASADPVQDYRDRQANATPQSVMTFLRAGNARFAQGTSTHGGYVVDATERRLISAKGQRPLAVVLSCIDSRNSPELIFDTSVGDIFTARVGANVINEDILGSMEIAVESGAKVIVVMGHTRCGGIAAACAGAELGHFTQLLAKIKPVIEEVNRRFHGDQVPTNPLYIKAVSHANARQSFRQILERSTVIKEKVDRGEIQLKSALYDVDSGIVTFD